MKLPVEESEFIPCDILDIVCRIRPHNPTAAARFVEAFKSSVELLARMPEIGHARPDLSIKTPFLGPTGPPRLRCQRHPSL